VFSQLPLRILNYRWEKNRFTLPGLTETLLGENQDLGDTRLGHPYTSVYGVREDKFFGGCNESLSVTETQTRGSSSPRRSHEICQTPRASAERSRPPLVLTVVGVRVRYGWGGGDNNGSVQHSR
jgi:hypothetical protein